MDASRDPRTCQPRPRWHPHVKPTRAIEIALGVAIVVGAPFVNHSLCRASESVRGNEMAMVDLVTNTEVLPSLSDARMRQRHNDPEGSISLSGERPSRVSADTLIVGKGCNGNLLITGRIRYAEPGCSNGALTSIKSQNTSCNSLSSDRIQAPPTANATEGTCADRPARRARVELWTGSSFLFATATNGTGNFSFCLNNNPSNPLDLYVVALPCPDGTDSGDACGSLSGVPTPYSVVVTNAASDVYLSFSSVATSVCTGTVDWDIIDRRNPHSGAYHVFDLLANDAFDFLDQTVSWANTFNLQVRFPDAQTGFTTDGVVHIADGDRQDPDRVLRAYSYFVLHQLYEEQFPSVSSACASSNWGVPTDPACALINGAARFLQGAMQDDPVYEDTPSPGAPPTISLDLELPTPSVGGEDDEGAVAAILWDLFDTTNNPIEPWDEIELGIGPLWNGLSAQLVSICELYLLLPVSDVDPIFDMHGTDCVPRSVNILTHGFKPAGSWEEFRSPWYALADKLKALPLPDSILDGRVGTYVSTWESTEGFLNGFVDLIVAKIAEKKATIVASQGNLEQAVQLQLVAAVLLNRAPLNATKSHRHAQIAANKIFSDVTDLLLLADPAESSQLQRIHLIGHSRGAAVNAYVSKLLVAAGYYVDQYSAIDGFSTDWPDDAALIGDLSITGNATVSEPGIGRKVNYRVQEDLANLIVDGMEAELNATPLPCEAEDLWAAIKQWFLARLQDVVLTGIDAETRALLRQLDLRAPLRAGFENIEMHGPATPVVDCLSACSVIHGLSHHVNSVSLYSCSDQIADVPDYVLDNYLGQDSTVFGSVAAAGPESLSGAGQAADGPSDFADGSFEQLGAFLTELAGLDSTATGVDVIDDMLTIIQQPGETLGLLWDWSGEVQLVATAGNTEARMGQTANTSLGQLVSVKPGTVSLDFDLNVNMHGSGDTLEVVFNQAAVAFLNLADIVDGEQVVSIGFLSGQVGQLGLRLSGPEADPSLVTLDNLRVVVDADGDGVAESSDCDDTNADVYPEAPEVNDGSDNQCPGDAGYGVVDETSGVSGFSNPSDKNEFSWPGQAGATNYEVARSRKADFSSDCMFTATTDTFLIDLEVPSSGQIYYYLNRPLAPNVGSWGVDSAGTERVLVCLE